MGPMQQGCLPPRRQFEPRPARAIVVGSFVVLGPGGPNGEPGQRWEVFADGRVTGFPEGSAIINGLYAAEES